MTKIFELPDKDITSIGAERFHCVVYCSSQISLETKASGSRPDIRKNLYKWHGHVPMERWVRDEEIDSVGSTHDEILRYSEKQPELVDKLKGATEMFLDV